MPCKRPRQRLLNLGQDRGSPLTASNTPHSVPCGRPLPNAGTLFALCPSDLDVPLATRATLGKMSPEYGSTVGAAVTEHDLNVSAVLSGNRNFEGRIHAQTQLNFLTSPPLVVAYALAGSVQADLLNEPLGPTDRRRGCLSTRHLAHDR